jgi:carbon starvation protein
MFANTPSIGSASIFMTIASVILGILIYRLKWNLTLATVIGIILMAISIWLGPQYPMAFSYKTWLIILFLYIIIAAAIPVNILLQPRDYLNSFLLYFGIGIGFIAALVTFKGMEFPVVTAFSPNLMEGQATPFWPAIPLIIACGSLSGFHSLVASGTSSKQLSKETDALFVGYGSMFTEGFLSTTIIVAIGGFGLTVIKASAAAANYNLTLDAANWANTYAKTVGALKLPPPTLIVESFAAMVKSSFLAFIPTALVKVIAGLWISAFALTTLDTTNRLARYCLVEILAPVKESMGGLYHAVTNRWVASLIPAALGTYLAWSGHWSILWPSFSAANQLIASFALMTGAAFVAKKMQSKFATIAVIPAWILWFTVTCAILWFMWVPMPVTTGKTPGTGWTVQVILAIMLVINFIFIYDFAKTKK